MKTTIDIPLPLLKKAKKYSEEHDITLKSLIEIALLQMLNGNRQKSKNFRLSDKSISGNGLQDNLNWNDWPAIFEMSYGERGGKK